MSTLISQQLTQCQRKVARRIRHDHQPSAQLVLAASNIHYEFAERIHGLAWGGIGAIHLLARRVGLMDAINRRLHLLKVHLPYHESDHVLALPYNLLADGTCLQDLDKLRVNEAFLDALGAQRFAKASACFLRVIHAVEACADHAQARMLKMQRAE